MPMAEALHDEGVNRNVSPEANEISFSSHCVIRANICGEGVSVLLHVVAIRMLCSM